MAQQADLLRGSGGSEGQRGTGRRSWGQRGAGPGVREPSQLQERAHSSRAAPHQGHRPTETQPSQLQTCLKTPIPAPSSPQPLTPRPLWDYVSALSST